MVPCEDLAPGGKHQDQALASNDYFSYRNPLKNRKPGGFLCPINIEKLGLQGNYGSEVFEYLEISVYGCDQETLPAGEVCANDADVAYNTFNIGFVSPQPNIAGDDPEEMVVYRTEVSHFYYLDPTHTQTSNIFFQRSILLLKKYIWDFFDFTEYELEIVEHASTQHKS